jgi:hypothetical protein
MSDIHIITVEGADRDVLEEMAESFEPETDDNIIVTSEYVEPLNRDEVKDYLQQFADTLDMELVER